MKSFEIQHTKFQSFLLNANNSSQPIVSITNGINVQKNNKYGEPVHILISDMKYALSNTVAVECKTIARNESSEREVKGIFSIAYRRRQYNDEKLRNPKEIKPFR